MKYFRLEEGDRLPTFSLKDANGELININDFLGKWLVIYFYPKDGSKGCLLEALDFSNKLSEFKKYNCEIIGISPDSEESHKKFIEKNDLKILLLSDPDHIVLEKLGVWQLKKMYGREHWGVIRTTILVDPDGFVRKIWENVKVKDHASNVLHSLIELIRSNK